MVKNAKRNKGNTRRATAWDLAISSIKSEWCKKKREHISPHVRPEETNGRHADDEQDGAADEHLRQRHLSRGQCSGRRFRPPCSRFSQFKGSDNGRDNHHHHHQPGKTCPEYCYVQVVDELLDHRQEKRWSVRCKLLLNSNRNNNPFYRITKQL